MTVAVPLADPDVAVMVAVPLPTAVTRPADETVATDELDVAHVMLGFEITVPAASLTIAVMVAVSPDDAKLTLVGDRVIEAAV